ncbi:MAG: amidophosphoribosyltransferase [Lachnospiraceae bacterium]|nr:amidophosphoribosyltransferase [Lachnospiraceae bacterium]
MEEISEDKLKEECGVMAILSGEEENIAKDIYYGLTALQHRGQESAGMALSQTRGPVGNIQLLKGMGLVNEVFNKEELNKLKGNIGVGHVRYSTTGGSVVENAQPISMNYIKGTLSLVHNGNIVNSKELKEKQMYRGQAHYTTSDSELLAYEIINERIRSSSIEEAVKNTAARIKGGYALVVMSPRKLVAIRDPQGIKPLILGKKGKSYIIASESCAIKVLGGEVIRDIAPGEVLTVSEKGLISDKSLCREKIAHCVFEYIYFARPDSVIDSVSVSEARYRAGRALAKRDRVCADIVCGVPDSGLIAAEGYADEAKIPFSFIFHKNSYIGRSFIKPTDEERKNAVEQKLSVLENVVRGKRIVLIDDSIVRGTTMGQIITMLRKAKATEVHVRISSPPFLYPCYYGTDVPSSNQLIASKHSTEEVRERIGADSLSYLRLEDFKEMVGELPLCRACFDNDYPV